MTGKELEAFIQQLNQKLSHELVDSFVRLDDGLALLDDWYTADELRQIANALDEIDKKKMEGVVSLGGKPILKNR